MNPHHFPNPKPDQCVASVIGGSRWGSRQCGTKKNLVERDGKLWCKRHDPAPEGTGNFAYFIDVSYNSNTPELVAVEIVKESVKQVQLRERVRAAEYLERISPDKISRSPREAWERYVRRMGIRERNARSQLQSAQRDLEAAEAGLKALDEAES